MIRCVPAGGGGGEVEPPTCDDGLEWTIDAYVDGGCTSVDDEPICDDGDAATFDVADWDSGRCLHLYLDSDPANCGSVGNAIPSDGTNNAYYACVAGQAVITGCEPSWAHADGDVANGCEVNLLVDAANCGSVGSAIPANGTNHASYACVGGEPVITSCQSGWADGDGDVANGCEVDVMTDPGNCGSVGNAIPADGTNHASYACADGNVVITACETGWADIDRFSGNGCEQFIADPDPTGNTQATAVFLGERTCADFPPMSLAGDMAGAGDHDWYRIRATGGSCVNDFIGAFAAPSGVVYDFITNLTQRFNLPPGTSTFTGTSPQYTSGTDVWIHVHNLPGSGTTGAYELRFNL